MRMANLLLTTALLATLGGYSFNSQAADNSIKVTSIAQVEVEVVGKNGEKTRERAKVSKAVPGTEVIYTNTFENLLKKSADHISINNAIPNDSEYVGGSAFGKDCEILFSVDGGKTFGHAEELKVTNAEGFVRTALPREYTNIRWNYKEKLAPGKSGEVGFRATIK